MQPLGEMKRANSGPMSAEAAPGQIIIRDTWDTRCVTGWPALTVPKMVLTQTAWTLQRLNLGQDRTTLQRRVCTDTKRGIEDAQGDALRDKKGSKKD